ncbi:hypothetical protein HDU97_005583 [Phlyctochytrium planicorne]|nr:hypothetical protein HDU97_005583 [Phlyctochytrium planicorne]
MRIEGVRLTQDGVKSQLLPLLRRHESLQSPAPPPPSTLSASGSPLSPSTPRSGSPVPHMTPASSKLENTLRSGTGEPKHDLHRNHGHQRRFTVSKDGLVSGSSIHLADLDWEVESVMSVISKAKGSKGSREKAAKLHDIDWMPIYVGECSLEGNNLYDDNLVVAVTDNHFYVANPLKKKNGIPEVIKKIRLIDIVNVEQRDAAQMNSYIDLRDLTFYNALEESLIGMGRLAVPVQASIISKPIWSSVVPSPSTKSPATPQSARFEMPERSKLADAPNGLNMHEEIPSTWIRRHVEERISLLDGMMDLAAWNKGIKRPFWKVNFDQKSESLGRTARQKAEQNQSKLKKLLAKDQISKRAYELISPGIGNAKIDLKQIECDESCFIIVSRHIMRFLTAMLFDTEQIEFKYEIFRAASPYGFIDFVKILQCEPSFHHKLATLSNSIAHVICPAPYSVPIPQKFLEFHEPKEEPEASSSDESSSESSSSRQREISAGKKSRRASKTSSHRREVSAGKKSRSSSKGPANRRQSAWLARQSKVFFGNPKPDPIMDALFPMREAFQLRKDEEGFVRAHLSASVRMRRKSSMKTRALQISDTEERSLEKRGSKALSARPYSRKLCRASKLQSVRAWKQLEEGNTSLNSNTRTRDLNSSSDGNLDIQNRWKDVPYEDSNDSASTLEQPTVEAINSSNKTKWTIVPFKERYQKRDEGAHCIPKKESESVALNNKPLAVASFPIGSTTGFSESRWKDIPISPEPRDPKSEPLSQPVAKSQKPKFSEPLRKNSNKDKGSSSLTDTRKGSNHVSEGSINASKETDSRRSYSRDNYQSESEESDNDRNVQANKKRSLLPNASQSLDEFEDGSNLNRSRLPDLESLESMSRTVSTKFCRNEIPSDGSLSIKSSHWQQILNLQEGGSAAHLKLLLWEDLCARPGTVPSIPKWKLFDHIYGGRRKKGFNNDNGEEWNEDQHDEFGEEEDSNHENSGGQRDRGLSLLGSSLKSPKSRKNSKRLHVKLRALHDMPSKISFGNTVSTTSLQINNGMESVWATVGVFDEPPSESNLNLASEVSQPQQAPVLIESPMDCFERLRRAERILQKCTSEVLMVSTELSWLSRRYEAPAASVRLDGLLIGKLNAWVCVHLLVTYLHGPVHPFHGPSSNWSGNASESQRVTKQPDLRPNFGTFTGFTPIGTTPPVKIESEANNQAAGTRVVPGAYQAQRLALGQLSGATVVSLFRMTEILVDLDRIQPAKLKECEEEFGYLLSNPGIMMVGIEDPRPLLHVILARVRKLAMKYGKKAEEDESEGFVGR